MNSAYNTIDRKVSAAFLLCGFLMALFFATVDRAQATPPGPGPQITQLSHKTTKEGTTIIKQTRTEGHLHLQSREKAKVFYTLASFAPLAAIHTTKDFLITPAAVLTTEARPAYYNFLFRYKPF